MLFGNVRRTAWQRQTSNDPLVIERAVEIQPSWDCTRHCHHEQKGDHGVGGETIRLLMRTPDAGVSLTLRTNLRNGRAFYHLGPSPDDAGRYQPPAPFIEADYLHDHLAMRIEADLVRNDTQPETCDVLASGHCYGGEMQCRLAASMWTADEAWAVRHQLIAPNFEELLLIGASPTWNRLTEYLLAKRDQALAAHAQLPQRCPVCHGAGLVPTLSTKDMNPPHA